MSSKKFAVGLAAAAALSLPFLFATPAIAAVPATLPSTHSLWSVTCDFDETSHQFYASLYSVNPANAVATRIGDTTGVTEECGGPAAFDPITGNSYYISWGPSHSLEEINFTTGVSAAIPWGGDYTSGMPNSMAIGLDGKAYIVQGSSLFDLDLTTGAWSNERTISGEVFSGFSVDPSTGRFYVMSPFNGAAYELNVETGATELLGTVLAGAHRQWSLQIDSAGTWWIEADLQQPGIPSTSQIWSGPRPTGEAATQFNLVGTFHDATNDREPYMESLLITYADPAPTPTPLPDPEPALAATGPDATLVTRAGVGALFLMLAGAAALVLRRRSRTK
jgi:hypothetical protein